MQPPHRPGSPERRGGCVVGSGHATGIVPNLLLVACGFRSPRRSRTSDSRHSCPESTVSRLPGGCNPTCNPPPSRVTGAPRGVRRRLGPCHRHCPEPPPCCARFSLATLLPNLRLTTLGGAPPRPMVARQPDGARRGPVASRTRTVRPGSARRPGGRRRRGGPRNGSEPPCPPGPGIRPGSVRDPRRPPPRRGRR